MIKQRPEEHSTEKEKNPDSVSGTDHKLILTNSQVHHIFIPNLLQGWLYPYRCSSLLLTMLI